VEDGISTATKSFYSQTKDYTMMMLTDLEPDLEPDLHVGSDFKNRFVDSMIAATILARHHSGYQV
jgi:hypothetical protein